MKIVYKNQPDMVLNVEASFVNDWAFGGFLASPVSQVIRDLILYPKAHSIYFSKSVQITALICGLHPFILTINFI